MAATCFSSLNVEKWKKRRRVDCNVSLELEIFQTLYLKLVIYPKKNAMASSCVSCVRKNRRNVDETFHFSLLLFPVLEWIKRNVYVQIIDRLE